MYYIILQPKFDRRPLTEELLRITLHCDVDAQEALAQIVMIEQGLDSNKRNWKHKTNRRRFGVCAKEVETIAGARNRRISEALQPRGDAHSNIEACDSRKDTRKRMSEDKDPRFGGGFEEY